MLSSSETRRRKKDPDRERSSPKSKDKDREERREKRKSSRPKSTRKTSSSELKDNPDRDGDRPRERPSKERMRTTSSTSTPKSHRMAVVPELERRGSLGSPNGSRTSLSYPTLSKTHAKENIYSREEALERRKSPLTPEATDVGDDGDARDGSEGQGKEHMPTPPVRAPPSPPLTATTGADLRKTASVNSMRRKDSETVHKEMEGGRRSVDSGTRLTPDPRSTASRSSLREDAINLDGTDLTSTTSGSQPSTVKHREQSPRHGSPKIRPGSASTTRRQDKASPAPTTRSRQASEITQSTDSDATSVAPGHGNARAQRAASPTNSEISPASVVDSSPRTPTQHTVLPSVMAAQKDRPPTVDIDIDNVSRSQSVDSTYSAAPLPPPPPPPPPVLLVDPPRVDYLLQNGGLQRPVVRSLLAAVDGGEDPGYSHYASPRLPEPLEHNARAFFQPLQKILDDYNTVMDKNGSIAVATGYRSVARRLLDRLEHVFARNISSEYCQCIMCIDRPIADDSAEINWGEILELVSGRCDLPCWPPFDQATASGLGISDLEAPCQRIDVDVPAEYRDHYARQSRKTKVAVQSWLSDQQDAAPEEADDETLTFAMLTRLEQSRRPLFYALLHGLDEIPSPRTTFGPQTTPPLIAKAASALQRLYRLPSPPRDQLVAMYLISNPDMHNILATLSAVTKHEWEILVSGRFDGFLWSGAEGAAGLASPTPYGPSRGPSRGGAMSPGGAPFRPTSTDLPQRFASPAGQSIASPRPGSTRPGSGPAPVQIDEETEISILAEVEREIYTAMEALENAFEFLHQNAEHARTRLRARGAALAMAAQARRGAGNGGVEVRTDTPASFRGDFDGDNLEDLRSEIGPDDSASNVSHNRRERAHKRRARRTPAPVEEESEEEIANLSLAERIRRRL